MQVEPLNYIQVLHPKQSPNDVRGYKFVQLPNKLKVILISDPTLEKSACAISVGVGSLCDPDRSLGLAHFLEHMLFMGSQKYPEHNEYSSFISNHGGLDNAYTDNQQTNYFFEIANEQFEEGVKRLADFFRKPMLNPDCVEKQRQAVHQEYQLWTSDDGTRKWEIIHALAEGRYARFSIGNQDTLNHEHILTDLRAYYDKTYSSNIINAVLVSNLSIEQQEKLLYPLGSIQNKGYEKQKLTKPFPPNRLGKLIKMQSIKDQYIMEFIFVVDNLKPLYRNHIDDYLTFVLGHESEGSLSAYLQSQGYVSQVMSFKQHILESTIVGLELTLTQPGTSEYKKIYEIVMQYIGQLKPQQFIYNDLKARAKLNWEFLQKTGSSSYSSKLASKLHYIDPEHILDHKIEFEPWNAELIQKYLRDLNESNLLLFLSSNNPIKGSVTQPFLGGKYKVEKLINFSKTNAPEFSFLKQNKFLPISTKLQPETYQTPQKLASNVTLYKKNNVCKGGLTLHIYSPVDKVFLELFEYWISMMLKESTYDASMLDSNMQFSSDRSLWVNLFGYNQVVLKLINIIGKQIHNVLHKDRQKSQIMFQIVRERMLQEYQNEYLDETDQVLANQFERICNAVTEATVEETIKTLSKMTMQQFAERVEVFWKNVSLEWIAVGNFDEKEILASVAKFQAGVTKNIDSVKQQPCIKLTQNFHFTIKIPSPQISTSGTLVYYEFDRNTFKNKLIIELLNIYIKQPFFDDLRTSKQLCYIAQTAPNLNGGIIGIKFTVVSSTTDPSILNKQIVTFVESHFLTIKNITEQKLSEMKDAVIVKQCEPFKNLQQQYQFITNQIGGRTYQWNRRDKEAVQQQLNEIKISDLGEAVDKILKLNFSIEAVADAHKKQYQKSKIKSKKFDDLRKKAEYHPDYQNPRQYIV